VWNNPSSSTRAFKLINPKKLVKPEMIAVKAKSSCRHQMPPCFVILARGADVHELVMGSTQFRGLRFY
jgi:hypothetical protein